MSTIEFRLLSEAEQAQALQLLGRCFPEYWEAVAARCTAFPFLEISHGAFENGTIVGHVGVVPFEISDGAGGRFRMGGIASVAVDPVCRGRKIARDLCLRVLEWARKEGFCAMPLYTGKDRVYETAGWSVYPGMKAEMVRFTGSSERLAPIRGTDLDIQERRLIMELYARGEDFCGKVLRGNGRDYLGWDRLLADEEYQVALDAQSGIYALFMDGAVVECYYRPDIQDGEILKFLASLAGGEGVLELALPKNCRLRPVFAQAGLALENSAHDLMHGEHPMVLDLAEPGFFACQPLVEFPLGDKF